MLEPDYYFRGIACYLSADIGSADDCGYRNDAGHMRDEPFDIYEEVVGNYSKAWRRK